MASITQKIQNYLGGVSKQPDVQMLPGQVREATNAYPDLTFGLIKRPGSEYIMTVDDLPGGKWFDIFRDGKERYIGCIYNGAVYVYNVESGVKCTVSYTGSAKPYITGAAKENLSLLTVQDTTLITNNKVVVKKLPDPPMPTPNGKGEVFQATVAVVTADYHTRYTLKINGNDVALPGLQPTRNGEANADDPAGAVEFISIEEILKVYETKITDRLTAYNPTGTVKVKRFSNTIEIYCDKSFDIEATGGGNADYVRVITNSVDNVSQLPKDSLSAKADGSRPPRILKVRNSVGTDKDDYYVQFIGERGEDQSRGYWEECLAPGLSPGLDASTMPHELVNVSLNTFEFRPVEWEPRLVGDDETNDHPSFVGKTIEQTFFFSNRLGFLSDTNVILSVAGEYFNFYAATAMTQTPSDPIDLSASSVKPGVLHAVTPIAQGLALFTDRQQFIMDAGDGPLTPTNTVIRGISSYEMDGELDPVDMGNELIFISKTPTYSRVISMMTRGQQENPEIYDVGRIVADWIPKSIDQITASPQNELFMMSSADKPDIYLFASRKEGEKNLLATWVKWTIAGNVQYTVVNQDTLYIVSVVNGETIITSTDLNRSTDKDVLVTSDGVKIYPSLDVFTPVIAGSAVYNLDQRQTKAYIPFNMDPGKKAYLVTVSGDPKQNGSYSPVITSGTDATGSYVIAKGDLTKQGLYFGYAYTYDITLPTTYFKAENGSDFPASLIVSRYKFAVGMSGSVAFKVKQLGNPEWIDRQPTADANYYLAGANPIQTYTMFTLPIHQRAENHQVRLTSDSPLPVALISSTWEGSYSPRYYRRAG